MLKGHADKFHKVCDNKVLVVACHSIGKSTLIKKKTQQSKQIPN